MEDKRAAAVGIALQTHVLKTCPIHRQLYFDDEVDPAGAFALAIELVRTRAPYVESFQNDEHALTDLLSEILATTPLYCAQCRPPPMLAALRDRGGFAERLLEGR